MIKQELLEYVHRQFQQGHDAATIKEHLITNGYIPEIADEAIKRGKNHKKGKEYVHKPMHIPFSAPSVAFLFVCVALFSMSMYWGAQSLFITDLAGAATEAVESSQLEKTTDVDVVIPTIENKDIHSTPEEGPVSDVFVYQEKEQEILSETAQEIDEEISDEQITIESEEIVIMVDNDKDGLSDAQENELGTNHLDQDTDDDGFFDGEEIENGTDPLTFNADEATYCTTSKDCSTNQGCNDNGICVACSDSDGTNYKIKGTTSGVHYTNNNALISTDACSEGTLLEFYCREDGYLFYQKINCAMEFGEGYYCSEGTCAKE